MRLEVTTLEALDPIAREGLFRLRHRVFKERLDWSVDSAGGMEVDSFDDTHAHYVVSSEEAGNIRGCLRLVPTHRPYMLAEVFPELAPGVALPRSPEIWEMSRFAFESDDEDGSGWGFSERALSLVREAVRFATEREIARYVLVTTVAVERMMLRQRLHCHRLGPPRQIGGVRSVALVLEADQATRTALGVTAACPATRHAEPQSGAPATWRIEPGTCGIGLALDEMCSLFGTAACTAAACH